jgi:hypothetical protein
MSLLKKTCQYLAFLLIGIINTGIGHSETPCLHGWIFDDQNGLALEGVNVNLVDAGESDVIITTVRSDPSGYYQICSREPGARPIIVWSTGYLPKRQWIELIGGKTAADFRLVKAATINGVVLNASNQPVTGARIEVQYIQNENFPLGINPTSGILNTTSEGKFMIKNIELNRPIFLTATHPEYKTYISSTMTLEAGQEISLPIVIDRLK